MSTWCSVGWVRIAASSIVSSVDSNRSRVARSCAHKSTKDVTVLSPPIHHGVGEGVVGPKEYVPLRVLLRGYLLVRLVAPAVEPWQCLVPFPAIAENCIAAPLRAFGSS